jgi:hypothetical protein
MNPILLLNNRSPPIQALTILLTRIIFLLLRLNLPRLRLRPLKPLPNPIQLLQPLIHQQLLHPLIVRKNPYSSKGGSRSTQ